MNDYIERIYKLALPSKAQHAPAPATTGTLRNLSLPDQDFFIHHI